MSILNRVHLVFLMDQITQKQNEIWFMLIIFNNILITLEKLTFETRVIAELAVHYFMWLLQQCIKLGGNRDETELQTQS